MVRLGKKRNKFEQLAVKMKLDYKDSYASPRNVRKKHWLARLIGNWRFHSLVLAIVGVSSLLFLFESEETQASSIVSLEAPLSPPLSQKLDFKLELPDTQVTTETIETVHAAQWKTAMVKSGDTLARIAQREGISAQEIHKLMQSGNGIEQLARIKPGDTIKYQNSEAGELLALSYDLSQTERLIVNKESRAFTVSTIDRPFEIHQNRTSATIQSSMYGAAKNSGLSDNLIMEMASIFGYDIDFALDVRKGDTFNIIWDEYHRDGEKIKDGPILAAEFINRGRVVRAVRYTNEKGDSDYFSPDGKSLRKAFLRSSVHFTRISSKFNPNRLHPIYKTKRPHRGVDYAARTGTPIYSAGDGKIIFRGKQRGYGNVVIVQHGNTYNTLYAHMSKFNSKARKGSRVKQGQTIGYVGQTGWATGPHLHYEFRVNGTHRNPLTVKLPTAKPLAKKYLSDFQSVSSPLLAQLDTLGRTQLALLKQ